jgi:hypothetical protein
MSNWNFIGSRFYVALNTAGPISASSWTDMGFDLSAYSGDPLLFQTTISYAGVPVWNNGTAYGLGATVRDLTLPGVFYICLIANSGHNPFGNPTYWGADTPPGINFQWSSTTGTLTPVPGCPSFLVPYSAQYWDETGVGHPGFLFTPPAVTGAKALFAQMPVGGPGPGGIWAPTTVYLPFSLYYWLVPPPSGSVNENLYDCNGVFDYSAARGDVLKSLIGSMAGTVIPPGDLWHVFAGAYNPPTAVLTDADLRDSIKGDFRVSRRDLCNGVKGTFIPAFLPTNKTQAQPSAWRWTDFPPYQGNGLLGHPNYIAEDGGAIIWKEARFGFTTSIWMVQRLAKIVLQLLRFQISLHLACKLTAFPVQAGDTITFIHARWAALANPPPTTFFVTQATLIVENTGGVPTLGVDLVLRQHDPSIYQFTAPSSPTNQGEYSAYGTLGTM